MPDRVRSVTLDGRFDAAAVFAAVLREETDVFWLDSGRHASHGFSWMGAGRRTVTAEPGRDLLDELAADLNPATPVDAPLGWVGFLGYEYGERTTGVRLPASEHPDGAFLWCDRLIEFDHGTGAVRLRGLADAEGLDDWLATTARRIVDAAPVAANAPARQVAATWRHAPGRYAELVRRCQESIVRGDAYQLCLTNRITVDGAFDPFEVYLRLRAASPSHHGGFLRIGDLALLSSSPERFLSVDGDGIVTTEPIKGTRPRGTTLSDDLRLRNELEASDKEQAENLMIVDLMRNDLGRIAELGTVAVTRLLAVESYAQVHQLVSTVQARLAPGLTAIDAVRACFPAGSMTGAPKLSAMGILAGLEQGPRGVYSGAFGYLSVDGRLDLAMVIRSIVLSPTRATIGTGGGITALSDPDAEVEETRVKARALLAALGASPTDHGLTPGQARSTGTAPAGTV